MIWIDVVGLGAGLFVVLAFYMTNPSALRFCAIISNLLFVIYAAELALWPVLILHLVLLPLNGFRLAQIKRTETADPGRFKRRADASGETLTLRETLPVPPNHFETRMPPRHSQHKATVTDPAHALPFPPPHFPDGLRQRARRLRPYT